MADTTPSTRDRIVDASGELFRRQGYVGTGVKQIVEAASAPFGSLYHFFPGGKEELGAAVIRSSGDLYRQLFEVIVDPAPDLVTGIEVFFAGAAETLRETEYADACPIATVALEVASTSEPMREATAEVFESWIAAAGERLLAAGVAEDRARSLAIEMINGLEGAFVLSRAMRTTEPVEIAGEAAVEALRTALGG
jgi:AcrR family transcriptional regulator